MRGVVAFFSLIGLAAVAPSCSSTAAKAGDAASPDDVGQTHDVGQANDVGQPSDARSTKDLAPEVPADAALVPPAEVIFPEAPPMSCGAADECQFPPSACADPSCDGGVCPGVQWIVYYDSPTCVNGQCEYTKRYFQCLGNNLCSAGGCRFNGTLAAAP